MPKFIVKERSFINNALVEAGTEIEYDPGPKGEVADNLEPVKKGKDAAADASTDPKPAA